MSARRAARDRRPRQAITRPGDFPRALSIGACAEVWADPQTDGQPARAVPRYRSVRRRYRTAVHHWRLNHHTTEVETTRPGFWSLEDGPEVTERNLAQAGCTTDDLEQLRAEALALLERAHTNDDRTIPA